MLCDQLRNIWPPMSPTSIRHHTEALEGAIEAIRSELAQGAAAGAETQRPRPSGGRTGDISAIGRARSRAGAPRSFPTLISIIGAVVVAAAATGGYDLEITHGRGPGCLAGRPARGRR